MVSSSVLEVLLGVLLTTVEFDSSSVFEVSLLHPIAIIKKTKKQREKDLIFDI
ncbi:MAG: Uncharacterised protein [uncultured Bacteroidota bacterium]|jgi:hypothetical protein|nr:MAG: Uncharacterised protein [uncultured Bacteroidetes bacterium]